MHPVRKQRLIIVLLIVSGVGAAAGLTVYALRQNINAFYTPEQIAQGEVAIGQRIRVGGLVVEGSVQRATKGLQVTFDLTDTAEKVTVAYSGILPDLFREGQGILAKGILVDTNRVEATEFLAKHDENYMSPEVKSALEKAGHPGKASSQPY